MLVFFFLYPRNSRELVPSFGGWKVQFFFFGVCESIIAEVRFFCDISAS